MVDNSDSSALLHGKDVPELRGTEPDSGDDQEEAGWPVHGLCWHISAGGQ